MLTEIIDARLDHLYWAADRILAAAERLPTARYASDETATVRGLRATLVHELDVALSWRLRLQGEPEARWTAELDPADYPTVAVLRERWREEEAEDRAWLGAMSDADLLATISVGDGPTPLWMYIEHRFGHTSQQLADAASVLTAQGQSPGDLDFLDYLDAVRARDRELAAVGA
jgi:uncharacterized damage-inducible protein DinB